MIIINNTTMPLAIPGISGNTYPIAALGQISVTNNDISDATLISLINSYSITALGWAASIPALPLGYINGFTLSNDATTPASKLNIAAGAASNSTGNVTITGTTFSKTTSGVWTVGAGNAGLGTGLTVAANTWYHVFAIMNNGVYDVYFDTSLVAANAPANTTAFRYIGSFRTDASSNILSFTQIGQAFLWSTVVNDLSGTGATALTALATSTPPGFSNQVLMKAAITSATPGNALNILPGLTAGVSSYNGVTVNAQVASIITTSCVSSWTNTARQIYYNSTSASDTLLLQTIGYINPKVASNIL